MPFLWGMCMGLRGGERVMGLVVAMGGGGSFCLRGGGVWNPKVQRFVYQKQPKSVFPFVKFHFFQQLNPGPGGGGVLAPPSPPPAGAAELLSKTLGGGGKGGGAS